MTTAAREEPSEEWLPTEIHLGEEPATARRRVVDGRREAWVERPMLA